MENINSPIIFNGNSTTAYRDPAVLYHDSIFYLYFTLVEIENDSVYSYTAFSKSDDLVTWTPPKKLTVKNQNLNYCSPGNVIKVKDEWILCLQTYPRPNYSADKMPMFGNGDARIFKMKSSDL